MSNICFNDYFWNYVLKSWDMRNMFMCESNTDFDHTPSVNDINPENETGFKIS